MAAFLGASICSMELLALSLCCFCLYKGSRVGSVDSLYLPLPVCLTTPSFSRSLNISSIISVESVFAARLSWPLLTLPRLSSSALTRSFCFTVKIGDFGFGAILGRWMRSNCAAASSPNTLTISSLETSASGLMLVPSREARTALRCVSSKENIGIGEKGRLASFAASAKARVFCSLVRFVSVTSAVGCVSSGVA